MLASLLTTKLYITHNTVKQTAKSAAAIASALFSTSIALTFCPKINSKGIVCIGMFFYNIFKCKCISHGNISSYDKTLKAKGFIFKLPFQNTD